MFKGILIRLRLVALLIAVPAFALGSTPISATSAILPTGEPPNPYYSVEAITLSDGTQLDRITINGPPTPPPGYERERAAVAPSALSQAGVAASLPVPAYNWVFGCSAVSASMIGAYFDRNGLPNIYTGPTNGGVMPLDNSVWPTWSDGSTTYPGNPLAASRNGSDGRAIKGSIDDYWVAYESNAQDPYITGAGGAPPWAQHTWGDAFGDYMKTSQSAYDNVDGSTTFWTYMSNPAPLTCAAMVPAGLADTDGTYGRKLFYEARGYSVTDCYNQKTDNNGGNFSFASYKAQIDAGYPVLLNLRGHSVVGVGYADPSTVYLHDTWDYQTHQMTWGGSYSGMALLSVSIVNPALPNPTPTITGLNPFSVTPGGGAFTLTVSGTNFVNGSVVQWNGAARPTTYVSATKLTAAISAEDIAAPTTAIVTVSNPGGSTSNGASFLVGTLKKVYLPLVQRGLEGISGRVTNQGAAATGIQLQLRFYNGSTWAAAKTATTDSVGRYRFMGAASLGSGQTYYVRFGPNTANHSYVFAWYGPVITTYTSGSAALGGDFDIADVEMLSPPDGAQRNLPVTFTWQPRGIATDTYRVYLYEPATRNYWITNDLGNVGSATLGLPPGAAYNKQYYWWPLVFYGLDSYGDAFGAWRITFLPGGAPSSVTSGEWQIGEGLREPGLSTRQP